MFTDLPLELIGQIAGGSSQVYHPLVIAYPAFARSLTLGDRLDFAEKFGYRCKTANATRIMWYLHGKLHRVDGPAIEYANGDKYWYKHGKRHRVDGPAAEYANGGNCWYFNGKRHRVDGPAIEHPDGIQKWYLDGKLHRDDGPAIEYANGSKYWYKHGKLHRIGGSAIDCVGESNYWYINGVHMTESEHNRAVSAGLI